MLDTPQLRLVAGGTVMVAVLGAADAAAAGEPDLVALFAAAAVASVIVVTSTFGRRQAIGLRADLVRWLEAEAAAGGEALADVADRAIAAYRDGLVGDPAHTTTAAPP